MAKKATTIQKQMTKTELLTDIAETTGLSKKEVSSVLDALSDTIHRHIKKRSVGTFVFPGLLKIKSVVKPATKARKNFPKPGSPGEFIDIPAKPASKKVKVLPLRALKEMVL